MGRICEVCFSRTFRSDLLREETKYTSLSEKLGSDFHERVTGVVREIIKWKGGDHIGPHGFPCRKTNPFPFYVYYEIQQGTIFFLALVHYRRHPNFLKKIRDS